jgi:hypothetical protein
MTSRGCDDRFLARLCSRFPSAPTGVSHEALPPYVASGIRALDEDGTACFADYYLRLTNDGGRVQGAGTGHVDPADSPDAE